MQLVKSFYTYFLKFKLYFQLWFSYIITTETSYIDLVHLENCVEINYIPT